MTRNRGCTHVSPESMAYIGRTEVHAFETSERPRRSYRCGSCGCRPRVLASKATFGVHQANHTTVDTAKNKTFTSPVPLKLWLPYRPYTFKNDS